MYYEYFTFKKKIQNKMKPLNILNNNTIQIYEAPFQKHLFIYVARPSLSVFFQKMKIFFLKMCSCSLSSKKDRQ